MEKGVQIETFPCSTDVEAEVKKRALAILIDDRMRIQAIDDPVTVPVLVNIISRQCAAPVIYRAVGYFVVRGKASCSSVAYMEILIAVRVVVPSILIGITCSGTFIVQLADPRVGYHSTQVVFKSAKVIPVG